MAWYTYSSLLRYSLVRPASRLFYECATQQWNIVHQSTVCWLFLFSPKLSTFMSHWFWCWRFRSVLHSRQLKWWDLKDLNCDKIVPFVFTVSGYVELVQFMGTIQTKPSISKFHWFHRESVKQMLKFFPLNSVGKCLTFTESDSYAATK